MATFPHDEELPEGTEREESGTLPLSQHPAFSAIVVLWFAALFGLGTMVMPAALLEQVVSATSLPALLPAAAPPLGVTARVLLAVTAAVLGAIAGLTVARRVARAQGPSHAALPLRKRAHTGRKPINAHEELGNQGFDAEARTDEDRSAGPRLLAIADQGLRHEEVEAVPLRKTATDGDIAENAPETGEPAGQDANMNDEVEFHPYEEIGEDAAISETRPADREEAAEEINDEPLAFTAPSLTRRTASAPEARETVNPETSGEDWATAPLDRLGLVQLVQRLDASLQRRREWITESAAASEVPAGEPATPVSGHAKPSGFDVAPAEEAAQAMAAYFGAGHTATSESGDNRESVAAANSGLPQAQLSGELASPGQKPENIAGNASEPVKPAEFDPSASEVSPSPDEPAANSDEALRAALATLRRMSGAA